MTFGLIDKVGGWRSLISGFIIFSFLALAGLLVISGHSMHQFLAVAYLLVAAFVMTRLVPKASSRENALVSDAEFQLDSDLDDETSGCQCRDKGASGDRNSR